MVVRYDKKWNRSTLYKITVPANIQSVDGDVKTTEFTDTFYTTLMSVVSVYPNLKRLPSNPVFLAIFDQLVDPEKVLTTIQIYTEGLLGKKTHID